MLSHCLVVETVSSSLIFQNASLVSRAGTEEETLARLGLKLAGWLGRDSQPGSLKQGNKWKQVETVGDGKGVCNWVMVLGKGTITFSRENISEQENQYFRLFQTWCWVIANARQSPQICFPLRRRTGLKPYYKIHQKNVLGKLREKILINSVSWWLTWIRAGCNCHLGNVLLVVFIVLILLQFLEES